MKYGLTCAFFIFAVLPLLYAEGHGDVFGLIGVSWIHNDESNLGSGLNFGGGARFRASKRIGFQVEVDRTKFSRAFSSGVRFEGTATSFAGEVQFYFPIARVETYFFGGAGIVRFDETDRFPAETGADVFVFREDAFTLQSGAGVLIPIAESVSLRPEFRWSWNDVSFINQLRASAAIGYEW